jgi:putative peptide zinc metalloprotease protein
MSEGVSAPVSLASRLGLARVGLRADLEIHRQVFRGQPSYVIRDPMTQAVHRVSAADYQIVAALTTERALAETLEDLELRGALHEGQRESFYRFVLSLHSLGFLSLPVSDEKSLYDRRERKLRAKRLARVMGVLFMQIPVLNPDAFLRRTGHLVAWVFSRWAVMVWAAVVLAASALIAVNVETFFQPIGGLFTPERLIGLWFTLVGMKVLHEFGHAYACRLRGGEVPEMGVYLILGTPCAYVDATSSWGFTRRMDRAAVVLAGVYVELFVAALAVFAWGMTDSAAVRVLCFDVVLVSGIATILTNLNPLMRFDGYYLLSDLLEVPNLRAVAQRYTGSVIKRIALGTPTALVPGGRGLKAWLLGFGTASVVYRFTLVMGIAAILATKALWLGIGLAVAYAGGELFKALRAVAQVLIHSEEAALRRVRAGVLAAALFAVAPALVLFVPVPSPVKASAVVGREVEAYQYPLMSGFIDRAPVQPGGRVAAGEPVAVIRNDDVASQLAEASARLRQAEIRELSALGEDRAQSIQEQFQARAARLEVEYLLQRQRGLMAGATVAGEVIDVVCAKDLGRYVGPSDPVATIADGRWVVRAFVRAEAFAATGLSEGDQIEFRGSDDPWTPVLARVTRIRPTGSRTLDYPSLTAEAGGDIPISPVTGEASEVYYEVEAAVEQGAGLHFGMYGRVLLGSRREPLGTTLRRAGLRLLQAFEQG